MELNEVLAFTISQEISNDIPDPRTITEAQKRANWPQWEKAINTELDALLKRQVFGPVIRSPPGSNYTGFRWTFVRKRNAQGEIIRYRARLVAKGYTQMYGKDYDVTYSPVMDAITYRYMISFALKHGLTMKLMDVVTAYLYGMLDTIIYMQAPPELLKRIRFHVQGEKNIPITPELREGINQITPEGSSFRTTTSTALAGNLKSTGLATPLPGDLQTPKSQPPEYVRQVTRSSNRRAQMEFAVQVLRSINGLKQSGRIWYKRFKAEMLKLRFSNTEIAPCLFLKKIANQFIIVAIYVDDINLFGTQELTEETMAALSRIFEMKSLGPPNYCMGLQFKYLPRGILIHQETYVKKVLKQFNMDKATPMLTPMDMRENDPTKDIFQKKTEAEQSLGPEKPYLSAIGALSYLANQTRPDIAFSVNMLARHSKTPTIRHWNGVKRLMRYLLGTTDLGLLYMNNNNSPLTGYADARYVSNPDDAKSQSGYVFLHRGTAISWKSTKQTMIATSSNHAEIVALYEATREAIWL